MVEHILIASLSIFGLRYSMSEGNVLHWFQIVLGCIIELLPIGGEWKDYISKPFFSCVMCMSSVYGGLFWYFMNVETNLVVFIFAVCGLNYIISSIMDLASAVMISIDS